MTENVYCTIHHITYESEVERGKVMRMCPECEPPHTSETLNLLKLDATYFTDKLNDVIEQKEKGQKQ